MRKNGRFVFFSFFIILTYLMSACSGVAAGQNTVYNNQQSQSGETREVVFTGTVVSMGNGQWTVDSQSVIVEGSTNVDASIVVGDNVKVDAVVSQDGSITAMKIELAAGENSNSNDISANSNDSNTNSEDPNTNASGNENGTANSNNNSSGMYPEITGVVDAIAADSITIDGVVYALSNTTEYKNQVAVGDQVKVQIVVNSDGTFTVRRLEMDNGSQMGNTNDNSNSNLNGTDDNYSNTNGSSSYTGNSNDDHRDSGNNHSNSNDDDQEHSGGDD